MLTEEIADKRVSEMFFLAVLCFFYPLASLEKLKLFKKWCENWKLLFKNEMEIGTFYSEMVVVSFSKQSSE